MSTLTPEDRLRTVEKHVYEIQAIIEALDGVVRLAHLTSEETIGFQLGIMVDSLRKEADAILAAAATKSGGVA
ncbi:hypothetical protein GBZ48_31600 [Azospirillum melinis]|uniref:Uncharacterized protein n=1 Tax=Azospirillum melinis TaxID=328839 RepID=A0ABX2KMG5_9PROT|nr:hypothetical protein [Azospirillum melinis]MBP2310478.1 hypothetical protein [Azospirillum melinis]NUB03762.1 hypothetical protein [Azospirillum melinis]